MSDTPIGERPPQGGWTKQYESAAERSKAWRERRKAGQDAARGDADIEDVREEVPASLAEATLANVLDQLQEVFATQQRQTSQLVDRVEDAVAAISDPDAVAADLGAARAEAARLAADAEARAQTAEQRRAAAEATARAATAQATEADQAAVALDEQVEALSALLAEVRVELDETRAQAAAAARAAEETQARLTAEHHSALEAERTTAAEQLAATLDQQTQIHVAELATAEQRIEDAQRAQARAEGTTAALQGDLDQLRAQLPVSVDAARHELRETITAQHAAELDSAAARLETRIARLESERDTATARADAARQVLDAYRSTHQVADTEPEPPPRQTKAVRRRPPR